MLIWILIDCAVAIVIAGLVVTALAFRARSPGQSVGSLVRVLPDSIRLAAAVHADRNLPRSVRWRLRIALVYNLQPINLIPDFVPVIGLADNIFVIAWALRGAVSTGGTSTVESHWQGTPQGMTPCIERFACPRPPRTLHTRNSARDEHWANRTGSGC